MLNGLEKILQNIKIEHVLGKPYMEFNLWRAFNPSRIVLSC